MLPNFKSKALLGVQLIRSKRRTLSLEIREDLEVQIRAPRWAAESDIARFIESRRDWIDKARLEIKRRAEILRGSGGLYWKGQRYPLFSEEGLRERFCFSGDRFLIHPLWFNEAEKVAEAWFRKQAGEILHSRLRELSSSSGRTYGRFRLGSARTRWGSCSQSGVITLHWRLVWVPDWVRDYVILHELCHLSHFDHSRAFWQTLAGLFPDFSQACAWLKDHAGILTLPMAGPAIAAKHNS